MKRLFFRVEIKEWKRGKQEQKDSVLISVCLLSAQCSPCCCTFGAKLCSDLDYVQMDFLLISICLLSADPVAHFYFVRKTFAKLCSKGFRPHIESVYCLLTLFCTFRAKLF